MSTTEAGNWLGYILRFMGVDLAELDNVGAHSLKSTLPTWLQELDCPENYLNMLKTSLESHSFYFSLEFDLTKSLQANFG